MRVRQLGLAGFMVEMSREPEFALYATKWMPGPQHPLPELVMPSMPPPESVGALATAVATLPERFAAAKSVMMPDENGIWRPWRESVDSPVLVPETIAAEVSLQRGMAIELLADHRSLPVPADGERLKAAAQWVLDRTHPQELLRVALHWAFACEVCRRPWSQNLLPLEFHELSGPKENRQRLRDKAHRLIVPQLVRVIAADAVSSRRTASSDGRHDPAQWPEPVRTLAAEFLPCIQMLNPPSLAEIRTALWLLSHDSPFDGLGDDAPSMLMAYTFGSRSIGEPEESLQHWIDLVSIADDHPHGTWDEGERPSDLRQDLRTANGLDLRDVVAVVHWMLTTMIHAQNEGNQLWTLPFVKTLAVGSQGSSAASAIDFVAQHLITTVDQLQESICPLQQGDEAEDSVAVVRKRIEQLLHDRPLIQFDDGSIIAANVPDVVHRTIELCQGAHNGQAETARHRSQRIGRILGHSFEANVRGMCHSLQGGHRVLDRETVDEVVVREGGRNAKRADVVLCDADGNYLVIEATKKNLVGAIRHGNAESLDSYVDDHLTKLEQAASTSLHIRAISAECDAPAFKSVVEIVVSDLPLRHDAALAARFDERSGNHNPPFLCGITEFTRLIDFGHRGFSVPTLIHAWRLNTHGRSLGLYLSSHPL